MLAGTVVADSDRRLFVVLASRGERHAVAPVRLGRVRGDKRYAGDVAIDFGALGAGTAHCGAARVVKAPFSEIGLVLAAADLAACAQAAARAANERSAVR